MSRLQRRLLSHADARSTLGPRDRYSQTLLHSGGVFFQSRDAPRRRPAERHPGGGGPSAILQASTQRTARWLAPADARFFVPGAAVLAGRLPSDILPTSSSLLSAVPRAFSTDAVAVAKEETRHPWRATHRRTTKVRRPPGVFLPNRTPPLIPIRAWRKLANHREPPSHMLLATTPSCPTEPATLNHDERLAVADSGRRTSALSETKMIAIAACRSLANPHGHGYSCKVNVLDNVCAGPRCAYGLRGVVGAQSGHWPYSSVGAARAEEGSAPRHDPTTASCNHGVSQTTA